MALEGYDDPFGDANLGISGAVAFWVDVTPSDTADNLGTVPGGTDKRIGVAVRVNGPAQVAVTLLDRTNESRAHLMQGYQVLPTSVRRILATGTTLVTGTTIQVGVTR